MRKQGGIGSVYRPKYRNRQGALTQSAIWWIRYSHHGVKYRDSSKSEVKAVAIALLKQRLGDAGLGKPVTTAMKNTTLEDLTTLVIGDYERNGRDTAARQVDAFNWLRAYFGGDCLADEITTTRLAKYVEWRKEQPDGRSQKRTGVPSYSNPPRIGCSVATINRELASLRRAYKLAARHEPPMVARVPFIGLMRERNRRTGFFTYEEFDALRTHLPTYLRAPMTTAFFTGWRLASQLLTRQRKTHCRRDAGAGSGRIEDRAATTLPPRRYP